MRLIPVTELQSLSASAWEALVEEEDVVVTYDGEIIAVLSAASASLEETLADRRQARALLAVARMQRQARHAGLDQWSLERVNAEIDAVRRHR